MAWYNVLTASRRRGRSTSSFCVKWSAMSGLGVVEEMSMRQLEGRCGGTHLRKHASIDPLASLAGNTRRSSARRECSEQHKKGTRRRGLFALLILLAQQREAIVYETDSNELKLIGMFTTNANGPLSVGQSILRLIANAVLRSCCQR